MKKYNTHTHSDSSHDGHVPVDAICDAAIALGFSGVAITDHCEVGHTADDPKIVSRIERSIACSTAARDAYAGRIEVAVGVEIADMQFDPELSRRVLALTDYDIVIGASHLPYYCHVGSMVKYNFSKESPAFLRECMSNYLCGLYEIARDWDIDTFAHVLRLLDYYNRLWSCRYDFTPHLPELEKILHVLVERGIALEINTKDVTGETGETIGMLDIARMYRSMGGKYVTIGTDAHVLERLEMNFVPKGIDLLRQAGFTEYHYYKERKPIAVPLN